MKNSVRWCLMVAVLFAVAGLVFGGYFFNSRLKKLTESREDSFFSLQFVLKQLVLDESEGIVEKNGFKTFNDVIRAYAGVDENIWNQVTYGNSMFAPAIRYDSGSPKIIYETKDYPVSILSADHLEVCSSDFVVRWAKSGKVVMPSQKVQ